MKNNHATVLHQHQCSSQECTIVLLAQDDCAFLHSNKDRIITINFQSMCAKKEEFWCIIDAAKPDDTIGREVWLKPDISVCEIFKHSYHM